jgi:MFS transporter, PHS family, inorganic phosphate transporter
MFANPVREGPNATTFIVPGECFPTRYRSTSHGISAGSGKIGAIVAQVVFGPLKGRGAAKNCTGAACTPWINHIMEIFALFMFCGILTSLLIPETKRKTLEQLAGEVPGTPEYDPANLTHAPPAKTDSDNEAETKVSDEDIKAN